VNDNDDLIRAFVQGAAWWEYVSAGATMWPSDRDRSKKEAESRSLDGSLGKLLSQNSAINGTVTPSNLKPIEVEVSDGEAKG
jgi:hypothetical protein